MIKIYVKNKVIGQIWWMIFGCMKNQSNTKMTKMFCFCFITCVSGPFWLRHKWMESYQSDDNSFNKSCLFFRFIQIYIYACLSDFSVFVGQPLFFSWVRRYLTPQCHHHRMSITTILPMDRWRCAYETRCQLFADSLTRFFIEFTFWSFESVKLPNRQLVAFPLLGWNKVSFLSENYSPTHYYVSTHF